MERAVKSSVVLGIVGAGGIGALLEEPMVWADYREAAGVIVTILIILAGVERASVGIRNRLFGRTEKP